MSAGPSAAVSSAATAGPVVSSSPRSNDKISHQLRKEKVTQRIHNLRRKLNPRSNKARWRYRTGASEQTDTRDRAFSSPSVLIRDGQQAGMYSSDDECDDDDDDDNISILLDESGHGGGGATTTDEEFRGSDSATLLGNDAQPRSIMRRGHSYSEVEIMGRDSSNHSPHHKSKPRRLHMRGVSFDPDAQFTSSPVKEGDVTLKTFATTSDKEFRVKPHHCFAPSAVYMTEVEMYKTMMQPSERVEFPPSFVKPTKWKGRSVNADRGPIVKDLWGTPKDDGRIGSLRAEVLGCVGLASVKPDVSVYLICGDAAFVTDAIHSCRSPMWPSCSKRAAVFALHHAYARLYVGVFGGKKEKNDQFLGRIVLDVAALRPNTEYDVTFPLRSSSFVYDRRPRGVIRLRFSLHWFNERAAMLSYLQTPHQASNSTGCPTIPCGNPKTFRNVAVTLHGKDFPGKYTRTAFRATMREFSLSQQNLRFLLKKLIEEAILYEKPLFSLYIFCTWMYCVGQSSVRLAPAFFVGYLILNLVSNYFYFNLNKKTNLGFAPPTLREMTCSLLMEKESGNMEPLLVRKKCKANRRGSWNPALSYGTVGESGVEEEDIEPVDHREFPFSEREEYRKFTVDDALAYRSKSVSVSTSRPNLRDMRHRQLSIYEKRSSMCEASNSSLPTQFENEEEAEDEDDLNESDDDDISASVHGDDDAAFLFDEGGEDEDEDERDMALPLNTPSSQHHRRIPLGPTQDSDKQPRKRIPPQVLLSRTENKLHSFTGDISMDKIFHINLALRERQGQQDFESLEPQPEDRFLQTPKRRRRLYFDDFDKRLGFRKRHSNPVTQVTSTFLGPIMRIIRVFLVSLRVFFNIFAWRDPILSFWALVFLVVLMLILLAFPWRTFLFLVGASGFGPQNILLRKHMEARATKKVADAQNDDSMESLMSATDILGSSQHSTNSKSVNGAVGTQRNPEEGPRPVKGTRQRIQLRIAKMKERRRLRKEESVESQDDACSVRPPFTAHKPSKHSVKNNLLQPRDIVVPYSRGRTERFYDWPPDPTVSRATPLSLIGNAEKPAGVSVEETWLSMAPDGTSDLDLAGGDNHLRRRHQLPVPKN